MKYTETGKGIRYAFNHSHENDGFLCPKAGPLAFFYATGDEMSEMVHIMNKCQK